MRVRLTKSSLVCLLAIGVFLAVHQDAQACSCAFGGGAPCAEYWHTDAIFSGAVASQKVFTTDEQAGDYKYKRSWVAVHFSLEQSYKGDLNGAEIEVITGMGGGDCGYQFEKNKSYLVYAFRGKDDGKLYTGICSRTRPLREAEEDVAYFKNIPRAGSGVRIFGKVTSSVSSFKSEDEFTEQPLKGVKIFIESDDAEQRARVEVATNERGEYEARGLSPGKYKVRADLPKNINEYGEQKVEIVDRACAEIDFYASLNGKIGGRVIDANDQPVRGAKVDIIALEDAFAESPTGRWRFTSDNGQYTIDPLPPGKYLLGVNLIGSENAQCPRQRIYYPNVSAAAGASIISIGDGEKLEGYDLRLPPAPPTRRIEIFVLRPDGRPAPHAAVAVANGVAPHYLIFPGKAVDNNGHFTVDLPEGCRYQILAFTYGGNFNGVVEEQAHAEPVEITLRAKELKPLKLVLSSSGFQHHDDEKRATTQQRKSVP